MRGDVVYRVYACHEGRQKDYFFGAFRSISEAEAEVTKLTEKEMNGAIGRNSITTGDSSFARQLLTPILRFRCSPNLGTSTPLGPRGRRINRERGTQPSSRFFDERTRRATSRKSANTSETTQCCKPSSRIGKVAGSLR